MPASKSSPSALLDAVTKAGLPREPLGAADSIGLLQTLSAVPDPRQARGRRHGLQSILLLAVGAVLAGARPYAAIAQWAAHAEQAMSVCGPTPHATTFGRVLAAVDAAALQRALTGWVLARHQARQRQRAQDARPRGEVRPLLAERGCTVEGGIRLRTLADAVAHLGASRQVGLLDATEVRVRRPTAHKAGRTRFVSGKARANTVKALVITDAAGRLLFCGQTRPGAIHALTQVRQAGLVELLTLTPGVTLLADAGYQGLSAQPAGAVLTPRPARRKNQLPVMPPLAAAHEADRRVHSS